MNASVDRLALIRAALKQNSIDTYIIPLSDPHLGENIPDHWKIVPWLTGFTGSAATVVITDSFAGLWTDSRYFIQAEKQLAGSGFDLIKPQSVRPSDFVSWLEENVKPDSRIAFDGRIFSITGFRKLEQRLKNKCIIFDNDCDLITDIWEDRPLMPVSKAWDHTLEFSGKDRSVKMAEVREEMKKKEVDLHLLTSVDDIMWLLNIRGNDHIYSPLCISFALVGVIQILVFVEESKIPGHLASEFDRLGIVMLPYEETAGILSSISESLSILINPSATSVSLFNSIPSRLKIVEDTSIPSRLKARKNRTEIENISRVMIKDGIALTRFFHWIDNNRGLVPMTEVSIAVRLQELRAQQEDYIGASFATITAYNEHGALPHYSATSESDATLGDTGILLVDSGGHYRGGTTDITRSISLGNPTAMQKKDFTLVLKGHIALARAKFPLGTRGYQIDMLARKAIWENGCNYGHGTGHGVGYCLNVHEGPQSISPADNKSIIEAGMLISNEPGIYREGEYGIRTENLMICYEDEETEFGHFLKFDTVSLCYIDKSLIDKSLLVREEIAWINFYNSEVFDKLSNILTHDERIWLREKTESI
ncbi:MAG: aminopeptidase P family protein [Bacteroidia bacterium]|nr:aminopeptidase P family protein [Bacteroidia bacterium]